MKNQSIPQGAKRAAIYVRVSSEHQAETKASSERQAEKKASPEVQEKECRALCEARGYEVVEVYRDIEKYRVRGRLVEPSGTRSDRPQLLRMLADYDAGHFDVLVAWREDRLYRGVISAVIALKDRAKQGLIIEIVNGGFNLQTMEVLAWAAGVENEARRERRNMGMGNRFAAGKVVLTNPIYGYCYHRDTGMLSVNETESPWVVQIWQWFGAGLSCYEIRRRLIAAGAPQTKVMAPRRKYQWSLGNVNAILRRDDYFTGVFTTVFNGQTYEAQIPILIDASTFHAAQARRAAWKAYPAGNLKSLALVAGVIYCNACGGKMRVTSRDSKLAGGIKKRYIYYQCYCQLRQTPMEGCAKVVSQINVDSEVWRRVWALISEPERFEQALQERIALLRTEDADAERNAANLERQLDETLLERQQVIILARKGLITEGDLETQLLMLTIQERGLKKELSEKHLLTGNRVGRLLEMAEVYRKSLRDGLDALNAEHQTDDQSAKQFVLRRTIVEALVTRVTVHEDKSVSVEVEFGFPSVPTSAPHLSINNAALYTHYTDQQTFSICLTI